MSASVPPPTSPSSPKWHPEPDEGAGRSSKTPGRVRILVSAGPTHEPIDQVRYLGNRSSGRMGIAVAEAAARAGASTTLLLGPTHLGPSEDSSIQLERFRSSTELAGLLRAHWPRNDLLFMAAAVADYRPVHGDLEEKLRREDGTCFLELEPTPDLVAELAAKSRPNQVRIGWALEPREELIERARTKLQRKDLAAIVANPLETIDSREIEGHLLLGNGEQIDPPSDGMTKEAFAQWLLETILSLRESLVNTT